jgi:predicted PurR-regulated permease PerM
MTSHRIEIASLILAAAALFAVLHLGLLAALLFGLLIFQIARKGAEALERHGFDNHIGASLTVAALTIMVIGAITLAVLGAMPLVTRGPESVVALLQKMADVFATARAHVPIWAQGYLPADVESIETGASAWLRANAKQVGFIGQDVGKIIAQTLIGMIIGAMVVFTYLAQQPHRRGPLSHALSDRVSTLSGAFSNIVFSQIRISAINTFFTGVYLALVLPAFGIELPLVKTMIAVTFIAGLLPVIGNLISNTVIVTVALSYSAGAAAASLAFLVIIHKLEYFLNAKIIGSRIRAKAWELLIAMLVMEAAFGITGLIAAPIYYAYLKDELSARGLI